MPACVAALSILAAIWSIANISLFPPRLHSRALHMATASTQVVVDTPRSGLVNIRQDTYGLESLTNRAILLGNVIARAARSATPSRAVPMCP